MDMLNQKMCELGVPSCKWLRFNVLIDAMRGGLALKRYIWTLFFLWNET